MTDDRGPVFSVRISLNYRALGIHEDNEIIWLWIGSYPELKHIVKCRFGFRSGMTHCFPLSFTFLIVILAKARIFLNKVKVNIG